MTTEELVKRATELFIKHEPADGHGYWLAFSGGKDSVVIKKLAELAGVKFTANYNNTTIDPPELVHFIKIVHPDVIWHNPPMNMMTMVATAPKTPPTRQGRWCCSVYKERGGAGRVKVFGVRAAESKARATRWHEVSQDRNGDLVICPIVYWTDKQLWQFIKAYELPYCTLYDEGFTRIGCVGCPLAGPKKQSAEFARWPRYEQNWRRAIYRNWENRHDKINHRTGKPVYQAKFKSAKDFWIWWRTKRLPDYLRGNCQTEMLWTNIPGDEET